ncbi:MAG: 6-phospho-3-hexuloisomerase [Archaeoglobaceae archaeon]|uniref:6-phospho-3-hexuloisomerase n=1 Tax=Archaeoglobus fulgidus TaxID=2234 RepID=A0A7J3M233_ARCFL
MQKFLDLIMRSVKEVYEHEKLNSFIRFIEEAERIFVVGIGRSGLVAKAFAMRLMHLGYKAFVIGETTTPRIEAGDLLVAVSGSGETGYVVAIAKKAKEIGAKVVAITSAENSTLSKLSDFSVVLKNRLDKETKRIAPMGTLFEVTALVFLDGTVAEIIEKKNLSEEDLAKRHAIENEVRIC